MGAALIVVMALASACERIAPVRTLPAWVQGIYIPMFKNKTFEPEIEELATRLTQQAFLADGRLDVVPKTNADLTLVAEIIDWKSTASGSSGDKVTDRERVTIIASVKLFEPYNEEIPLAELGPILIRSDFNIDTRSNNFEPEPDRKHDLFKRLAREIVFTTIDGFPPQPRDLPPGVNLPTIRSPGQIQIEDTLLPREGEEI